MQQWSGGTNGSSTYIPMDLGTYNNFIKHRITVRELQPVAKHVESVPHNKQSLTEHNRECFVHYLTTIGPIHTNQAPFASKKSPQWPCFNKFYHFWPVYSCWLQSFPISLILTPSTFWHFHCNTKPMNSSFWSRGMSLSNLYRGRIHLIAHIDATVYYTEAPCLRSISPSTTLLDIYSTIYIPCTTLHNLIYVVHVPKASLSQPVYCWSSPLVQREKV